MKAVVLAAGEGSRMRPLSYTRPKVMIPLANKPILEHLLVEAKKGGITEFILIVGYHDEQIRNFFGDGGRWDIKIEYSTQRRQQGTADALRTVKDLLDGPFLMLNGDNIINARHFKAIADTDITAMSLLEVENTEGLGLVEIKADRVVAIHEKADEPVSNLANAGLYYFTPEIFTAISETPLSPRGEYEITDSIELLINKGQAVTYQVIDSWLEASYPWDLLTSNEILLEEISGENRGELEENSVIKGAVEIGFGTVVRSGSYIIGPVVIGDNCTIGPNCFIRPSTSIGDNCHIGSSVEVKNSIIMKNSVIPHHNYVGDSIIGEGCNLGAGTKIANLRLDYQNIIVADKDTGRKKMGAILGDEVKTGINASLNLGTMIGNNTLIGPGAVASGIISPNSKIY